MTTVADILDVLEALAPTGMKMDWDNVGLLCGSRKKGLLALENEISQLFRETALRLTHHTLEVRYDRIREVHALSLFVDVFRSQFVLYHEDSHIAYCL